MAQCSRYGVIALCLVAASCVTGKKSLDRGETCSADFECESGRCEQAACVSASQGWLVGQVVDLLGSPLPGLEVTELRSDGSNTNNRTTTDGQGRFQILLDAEIPTTLRVTDPPGTDVHYAMAWTVAVSEGTTELPDPVQVPPRGTVSMVHDWANTPLRADGFVLVQIFNAGSIISQPLGGEVIRLGGVTADPVGYLSLVTATWIGSSDVTQVTMKPNEGNGTYVFFFNADTIPGKRAAVTIDDPPDGRHCHPMFESRVSDYPLIPGTYTYVRVFCFPQGATPEPELF